jgi:hypothetical protein
MFESDHVLTIPCFAQSNMCVAHEAEYAMSRISGISHFSAFLDIAHCEKL